MSVAAGRLIVLEGPEGAGKSTQIRRLAGHLGRAGSAPLVLREPGGTRGGELIRSILLDPSHEISPRAEALLFMASRAELVARVVRPALSQGRTVLLDRFFLATYAYQIVGRGLPEELVRSANGFATGGLVPDLTLLLVVSASEGLARAARRSTQDRIERAGQEFHDRVERAFVTFRDPAWQREHPECGPIEPVDGEGTEVEVFDRLLRALVSRWPETFSSLIGSHH